MKLLDFDGQFEAYLQDWFIRSKGLFKTYDEMEDRVPEVYQTFLDTPAAFLDGEKPGEYFNRFDDPQELTDWMVAYEKAGVPVPDMLLNRISELGPRAEESLCALLTRGDIPAAARMSAVTLLREVDSRLPYGLYLSWLKGYDGKDELAENALDSLEQAADEIRDRIVGALPGATDEGRAALLSLLKQGPAEDSVMETALELFGRRDDLRAQLAGVLGRLGDERALPALKAAALDEKTGYLVYIELRSAIEQLGGEAPVREYEDGDPEYDSLKDL